MVKAKTQIRDRFETLISKVLLHAQAAGARIQKSTQRSYLNNKRGKEDEARSRGVKPQTKTHQAESAAVEALGGNIVCNCLLGNLAPGLSLGPNKLIWGVGDRGGKSVCGLHSCNNKIITE